MAVESKLEQNQSYLFGYGWSNLGNNKLSEHQLIHFALCEFEAIKYIYVRIWSSI
jgi:hypothetical protein